LAIVAAFVIAIAIHLFVLGLAEYIAEGGEFDLTAAIDWGALALAIIGVAVFLEWVTLLGAAGVGILILGLLYALAAIINDFPKRLLVVARSKEAGAWA
jgi:hypothetical protein